MDGQAFLAEFKSNAPDVAKNYERLCACNGTLEDFLRNPLVFICSKQPRCCLPYAKAFVEKSLANGKPCPSTGGQEQVPTTSSEAAMPPLEVTNTVKLLVGPSSGEQDVVSEALNDGRCRVAGDEERFCARSELELLSP